VELETEGGVRDDGVVERDTQGAGTVQDIDAFEGVLWVDEDWGVFFEPLVCRGSCLGTVDA